MVQFFITSTIGTIDGPPSNSAPLYLSLPHSTVFLNILSPTPIIFRYDDTQFLHRYLTGDKSAFFYILWCLLS
jgi:hypothetical protein